MDDPPGYARELQSDLRVVDAKVDSWLYAGASQFSADPELQRALIAVAEHEDSRQALLLLAEILRAPGLADRLGEVLRPESQRSTAAPVSLRRDPAESQGLPVRGYLQN